MEDPLRQNISALSAEETKGLSEGQSPGLDAASFLNQGFSQPDSTPGPTPLHADTFSISSEKENGSGLSEHLPSEFPLQICDDFPEGTQKQPVCQSSPPAPTQIDSPCLEGGPAEPCATELPQLAEEKVIASESPLPCEGLLDKATAQASCEALEAMPPADPPTSDGASLEGPPLAPPHSQCSEELKCDESSSSLSEEKLEMVKVVSEKCEASVKQPWVEQRTSERAENSSPLRQGPSLEEPTACLASCEDSLPTVAASSSPHSEKLSFFRMAETSPLRPRSPSDSLTQEETPHSAVSSQKGREAPGLASHVSPASLPVPESEESGLTRRSQELEEVPGKASEVVVEAPLRPATLSESPNPMIEETLPDKQGLKTQQETVVPKAVDERAEESEAPLKEGPLSKGAETSQKHVSSDDPPATPALAEANNKCGDTSKSERIPGCNRSVYGHSLSAEGRRVRSFLSVSHANREETVLLKREALSRRPSTLSLSISEEKFKRPRLDEVSHSELASSDFSSSNSTAVLQAPPKAKHVAVPHENESHAAEALLAAVGLRLGDSIFVKWRISAGDNPAIARSVWWPATVNLAEGTQASVNFVKNSLPRFLLKYAEFEGFPSEEAEVAFVGSHKLKHFGEPRSRSGGNTGDDARSGETEEEAPLLIFKRRGEDSPPSAQF